ncbi:tRNA:m(4)X modification enzyme TRM13 homolog [Maniola hyperantus]|uniref:tRNA:m(4)X modification enzyme TRM13 homolog n=1 Tax=Aphantopus hyperantus TaxID=2795564 RepID=UPI001569DABA|nr:tRNA:m(4)X modification enzyme TRM13 homolog [Maniola hyperantus]
MNDSAKTVENSYVSPQCQYFVKRKKRLCRMTVKPGKQYCGEHEPQPKTGDGQDDTRIPCPNDPKHTCYASKLEKHLSICNARQQEQPDYLMHQVNAPAVAEECPRLPLSKTPLKRILQVIDKVNALYETYLKDKISTLTDQPIHSAVLPEFNEAGRTESSLRHLRQASSLLHVVEEEELVANNTAYVELGAGKGHLSYYAWYAWCQNAASRVVLVDRASLRHKRDNKLKLAKHTHTSNYNHNDQIYHLKSSPIRRLNSDDLNEIFSHLDDNDKMDSNIERDPNNGFNEKLNDLDENHKRIDVSLERNPNNNEICDNLSHLDDKMMGSDLKTNPNIDEFSEKLNDLDDKDKTGVGDSTCEWNVHRIRADLAHLVLERVPAVRACGAVVGYAKHLCGVATDLALRCVTSTGVVDKVRGVVVASCCHHRCERAVYPATALLQKLGINADDFNALLGIVSWATCGDGRSRDRRNLGKHTQHTGRNTTEPHDIDTPEQHDKPIHNTNLTENTSNSHRSDNPNRDNPQLQRDTNVTHSPEHSTQVNYTNSIKLYESDNPKQMNSQKIVGYLTESKDELGTKKLDLSREQRELVGRRAKALLDWGRTLYLRECGFDARLVYYVPPGVSLENVCIVATKVLH